MSKTFVFVGDTAVGGALTDNLVKAGFTAATSASEAEVIFTYCATQSDLEDVYFETNGLVQVASKGTYLVDMSASTPSFARELNAVALVSDLYAVEAPLVVRDISVERTFSDPRNLLAFVSFAGNANEEVEAMIRSMVGTIELTDQPGSAQLARALTTLQIMSQLIAIMEADALCRVSQATSSVSFEVARKFGFITEGAANLFEAMRAQRFSGDYTVALCMAELTAVLMAADDLELILPGAEASLHLLELLAVIGGGDMSPAALCLVYGEESACAAQGLDWTRAEQAYGDASCDCDGDCDGDDDCDCDHHHDHGEYPRGFGGYSAN